ncbi:hypothetical protein CH330_01105 [candidate division WOR-3 bacterium JGI_Cruoil_03_51_56]|uniref:Uncharacterized protein n=1 Tax=candidate division WOR-3 bacterium JGI_Cruoil_03_51_56 TaxID=1973747 RepID=A0A235BZQ3_UNCW3|nr:MAG: hypothetical protein CH330_01105 [candidate division WOR-3 bacterium JGI_Cruoil_03_51_56]
MKTLGEFYREKVLSRKDLSTRELPVNLGETRIEKEIFGWRLVVGQKMILCKSEAEARFLKVFLDVDMTEVEVPKDQKYLESILPELERLKARMDKVLNFYLETIFDRRARERLRREVFAELLK